MSVHQSHPEIIKRLKRADGHLRNVIEMIEAERPCLDIAQQLHAVEKAITAAKKELIHDHIDNCLEQSRSASASKANQPMAELKEITKYL